LAPSEGSVKQNIRPLDHRGGCQKHGKQLSAKFLHHTGRTRAPAAAKPGATTRRWIVNLAVPARIDLKILRGKVMVNVKVRDNQI
jgi:hypothetical protein